MRRLLYINISYSRELLALQKKNPTLILLKSEWEYGAGDEARTRYLHLGKVALYRMSYARNGHGLL